MKPYFNVLQGKIAHYEQDVTRHIAGFFTDDILTCCFIVFTGIHNGKRRISVFHADLYVFNFNQEQLFQELSWVGKSASCEFFINANNDGASLLTFISQLNQMQIPANVIKIHPNDGNHTEMAVTFDQQNKVKGYTVQTFERQHFSKEILNHPQALKIYSFYRLNMGLQEFHRASFLNQGQIFNKAFYAFNHNPLLFDGEKFTLPGEHDLSLSSFATFFLAEFENTAQHMDKNDPDYQRIAEKIKHSNIPLPEPFNSAQCTVLLLMEKEVPKIYFAKGKHLKTLLFHSGSTLFFYRLIQSNFDIDQITSGRSPNELRRYLQVPCSASSSTIISAYSESVVENNTDLSNKKTMESLISLAKSIKSVYNSPFLTY